MDKQQSEIKLTKRQKDIIGKLQNGWVFICGQEFGAILTKGYVQEQIRLDVFYRLVKMGLTYQEHTHWHYVLTDLGKSIKITTNG